MKFKIGDIVNIQGKDYYRNQKVNDVKMQNNKEIVRCDGWLVFVYADQCTLATKPQR